ncbi:MAG TPA: methyltransferase domain-containing protein [Gemmataceae bacterium]|jgi:SAM-dependent methyltransferase
MWQKYLKRMTLARKLLRALMPHLFVGDREGELFGQFNDESGELVGGFPVGAGDTVVDVGCGGGWSSAFAARRGAAVYAVDVDPQALAAVEHLMKGRPTARPFHTLLSDANPLPLADGIATRIVAQEVMEHVDDPRQFLRELVRIGRPGARYLLSVPDPASEALNKVLAPEAYWRKPNHLRVLERAEFDRLVTDAGLRIEKRASYSFFWAMWWVLFWSGGGDFDIGSPGTPVLTYWHKTWAALLKTPNGPRIKQALDDFMPKSQVIIACKAA